MIPKELHIDQFNFVPIDLEDELEKMICDEFNKTTTIHVSFYSNDLKGIIFDKIATYEITDKLFGLNSNTFSELFEKQFYTNIDILTYDRERLKTILRRMFKCEIDNVV